MQSKQGCLISFGTSETFIGQRPADTLAARVRAKVLDAAAKLGLPGDPKPLAKLVPREDFARLTSALIRLQLAKDYDAVRSAAGG
jgi:hypothetical protein